MYSANQSAVRRVYIYTGSLEDPRDETSQLHPRGTQRAKGEKEKKIGLPSHGPRVTSNLAHIISPDSTPVHLTIVLYLLPFLLFHSPFHFRPFSDIRLVVNRRSPCTKRAFTLFVVSPFSLSLSLSLSQCSFLSQSRIAPRFPPSSVCLFLLYSVSSFLYLLCVCSDLFTSAVGGFHFLRGATRLAACPHAVKFPAVPDCIDSRFFHLARCL